MKTKLNVATLALLSTIILQPASLFGQGALTPPGAPGPTMKSLAQIEPRTPISSVPYVISAPGSYYLTTNLTTTVSNAIVITANGVTLDLSGFTISSTVANAANGGAAILIGGGLRNLTILNGFVEGGVTNNGNGVFSGSGFASGINCGLVSASANTRVSGVSVAGCLTYGINLSTAVSTLVEACMVRTVGGFGILASTVKGSSAMDCGETAIFGLAVADCRGESGGYAGIQGRTVQNCYGSSISDIGLSATTAQNCYGSSSSDVGISATTAQNCNGFSYGSGQGILADNAHDCNGSSISGVGLYVLNTALNCFGISSSGTGLSAKNAQNCTGYSSGSAPGILAETASNCYGESPNRGISANVAISCSGRSDGGSYGLFATSVANTCYGYSASGTGLNAYIAIGCTGSSVTYTYHYNMPP